MAALTPRRGSGGRGGGDTGTLASRARVWCGVRVRARHGGVEIIGRDDVSFEDRLEDTNAGPQPEIGAVEKRRVALEGGAAAARLDVVRIQGAQLIGEDVLQAAGTGGEEALHAAS